MEIKMPRRNPPSGLARLRYELQAKTWRKAAAAKYKEALVTIDEDIRHTRDFEKVSGYAIHKGAAYFLKAQVLLYLHEELTSDSVKMFLLAYVEDALNVPYGTEEEAKGAPAGRWLADFPDIDRRILDSIITLVRRRKETGQWSESWDTESVLADALSRVADVDSQNLLKSCNKSFRVSKKRSFELPKNRGRSVFVGGPYKTHLSFVRDVKEYILEYSHTCGSNFLPISADDYIIPEEKIHENTLKLLEACQHAIFEISFEAGQLMEIERTLDYKTRTLLVSDCGSVDKISLMVTTCGYEPQFYEGSDDLKRIVFEFLKDGQDSPKNRRDSHDAGN